MIGFGDLGKLAKIQSEIARVQEELQSKRIEASSGGGMVRAVMNGHGELVDLSIDPQVVNPEEVQMLQDLILAAVEEAKRRAQKLVQEEMGKLLPAGLAGKIPGLLG
ncbi:MAG: YbaB/EbfC family nucleoid-associated protein [Thermodesulfobacteriota bacterium]